MKLEYMYAAPNLFHNLPSTRTFNVCVLGGTGFVGKWLVFRLLQLAELEGHSVSIHIVTRSVQKSRNMFPKRFLNRIHWIEHDLNKNQIKDLPIVNYYVNGPTPSIVDSSLKSQESLVNVTLNGVKSIKESLRGCTITPRVINLSSGAVYGKSRSVDSPHFEADPMVVNPTDFYARAKIEAERMLKSMSDLQEISLLNLRLFSLYGPWLRMDKHFAIGNFMKDALSGRAISIKGNAGTKRSFLFGGDLATALLRSLFSDYEGALNIGGKTAITMETLANLMNSILKGGGVEFLGEHTEPNYYYPSVSLSEEILGHYEITSLEQGLTLWKNWFFETNKIDS